MDRDRGVCRAFGHLRDRRVVEDLRQEFDRHGGRNDFFQLRRHRVSDGRDMRQFQSGLGKGDEIDRRVNKHVLSLQKYL